MEDFYINHRAVMARVAGNHVAANYSRRLMESVGSILQSAEKYITDVEAEGRKVDGEVLAALALSQLTALFEQLSEAAERFHDEHVSDIEKAYPELKNHNWKVQVDLNGGITDAPVIKICNIVEEL